MTNASIDQLGFGEWVTASESRITVEQLNVAAKYSMHSIFEGQYALYEAGVLRFHLESIQQAVGGYALRGLLLTAQNIEAAPVSGTLRYDNFFMPNHSQEIGTALEIPQFRRPLERLGESYFVQGDNVPVNALHEPQSLQQAGIRQLLREPGDTLTLS